MKIRSGFIALLALILLGAACGSDSDDSGSGSSGDGSSTESTGGTGGDAGGDVGSLRVGFPTAAACQFFPAEVGVREGMWDALGLSVENVYVQGGGQVVTSLASGDIDMAGAGAGATVPGVVAGLEAKLVSAIVTDFDLMSIIVPADSDITGIEDLEGRSIGITSFGSLGDWLLDVLAADQGWDSETDITKAVVGPFSAQISALESGSIDAFVWSTDAAILLEEAGTGQSLASFGELVSDQILEGHFARDEVIEDRPEAVQAYLDGWYEAVAWLVDNRDDAVALLAEVQDLSPEVAGDIYDFCFGTLSADGAPTDAELEGLLEASQAIGQLDSAPELDEVYDGSFVPVG